MSETQEWLEQQRAKLLFGDKDARQMSMRMLDISSTNRVVTPEQAKMLLLLRILHARLSKDISVLYGKKDVNDIWSWLSKIADMFEEYQLTVGRPKNSREAFVDALKVELQSQEVKKRSVWTGV